MTLSSMTNKAGRKKTTIINASNVPLPSNNPIDETIGLEEVHANIKPTLDKIDAEIKMEKIFFHRSSF